MKHFSKILSLSTLVLGISTAAHATTLLGTISMVANRGVQANITSTGVSLTSSVTGAPLSGTNAATIRDSSGDFATLNDDSVNMDANIVYSSITSAGLQLFSFTNGTGAHAHTYTYSATSYSTVLGNPNGVDFEGTLYEDGVVVNTVSEFDLSNPGGTTPATFSALDTNPAPEPSSLILLGTGFVSAAGIMLRKRRKLVA